MSSEALPSAASEPRSVRAERKRNRILDAAGHCFATHGYAKTRVEEIAAAAGVSKGLVYTYFDSKESLLEAVLSRATWEWSRVTRAEVDEKAHGVAEAIALTHRAALRYARNTPVVRAILAQDPRLLLTGRSDVLQRPLAEWRERLIELLHRGVASGELRSDLDVDRTASVVQVLFLGFIDRIFVYGSIDDSDQGLVDATVDLMLYGVCASRPDAESSQA